MAQTVRASVFLFLASFAFISNVVECRAQTSQPERTVRVTTGSVQVSGWEQGIIQGNPNLSHFTWMPMSTNLQGIRRLPGSAGPAGSAPAARAAGPAYIHAPTQVTAGSHYVKPMHIATPVSERGDARPIHIPTTVSERVDARPIHIPTTVSERVDARPIHVPTPVSQRVDARPVHVGEAANQRDYVSGQLRLPPRTEEQLSGRLRPQTQSDSQVYGRITSPGPVATYGPATASQRSSQGQANGLRDSKEVYGRINNRAPAN